MTVVPGASVTGTAGNGIFFDTGTVTNFGTISGGVGIFGNTSANVVNSGSIVGTVSGNSYGIRAPTANVSNSGSIVATGQFASGVQGVTVNVSNSGSIAAVSTVGGPGLSAMGIEGTTVNVTNWGSITATSDLNGIGVDGGTLNVFNCGTISGTGPGANSYGIRASVAANVTNCGTISGSAAALNFVGGADTLTLLPGSRIIGAINLGGGGDTVNFRGGNHNLTFDTLAGATVTGTTPFVVVGNRAVAIDPTPFAAAGITLGDFSRSVSTLVPMFDNLPAATGGAPLAFAPPASPEPIFSPAFDHIPGLSAYAADQAVFKAPTVTHADGTTFWARGFGGQRIQQADGVVLRNVSNFFGGAMGMDSVVSPNLRIGGFIGAGSTRSSIDLNSGDTDSNLGFGGLYARYLFGASFLHAAVQGGGSRNDTTRNNINNNLVAGGIETAKASYNGWYVSPELTLGHRIALGQVLGAQHILTPSLQVRYLYGSFGSYTETGSTANLTVNDQTVQTLEERAELKLTRITLLNPYSALLVHLTGGALGVQRVGGNNVNAVLLGQAIPFATPGKADVWGGYGGLGIEFRNASVAAFGSAEYLALKDNSCVVSGKAGLRVAF